MTQQPSAVRLPVDELLAAVAKSPATEALRHKRRGRWLSWTGAAVRGDSAVLSEALAARGIRAGSIVAVSGDYAPKLLLFTIAAASLGASVIPVPPQISRASLAGWLRAHPCDLVFLGLREQLGTWRAAQRDAERTFAIVLDFHLPWGHGRADGVIAFGDLLPTAPAPLRSGGNASQIVWVEEGTEWQDGLVFALHVLAAGRVLTSPESRIAAPNDRRETQPEAFVISAAHRAVLERDLASRLPNGHGIGARLTRAALRPASGGAALRQARGWLLGRLRRPFGLSRLNQLTVVGSGPESAEDLLAALGIRASQVAAASSEGTREVAVRLAFA